MFTTQSKGVDNITLGPSLSLTPEEDAVPSSSEKKGKY